MPQKSSTQPRNIPLHSFFNSLYMFQTNQGPSFPAHQFLFTGSSAPTNSGDTTLCTDSKGKSYPCYEWFAAENSTTSAGYGCATKDTVVADIDPVSNEANSYNNGFPCYNRNSLPTLLDANTISWKYYTQSGPSSLWTGPNAVQSICYPLTPDGSSCGGYDWVNYVESAFPNSTKYPNSYSPILTDLGADVNQQQCALPGVSWVVPDGNWSDHAGEDPDGAGPAWVAAIVDAVGGYNNTGGQNPISCYDVINGKKFRIGRILSS
jgi:phospholipase C